MRAVVAETWEEVRVLRVLADLDPLPTQGELDALKAQVLAELDWDGFGEGVATVRVVEHFDPPWKGPMAGGYEMPGRSGLRLRGNVQT
jgi:hypothetical protein